IGQSHKSRGRRSRFVNPRYWYLLERAGFRCEYCHAPASAFNFPLDIEHIVPRSRQGAKVDDNLAIACRACNVFKGAQTSVTDPESLELTPLFNPRKDRWDEHFEFDPDSAELRGKTKIGQITIVALQLNSEEQRFARRQWIRIQLFP